ncbi:MAG TPA: BrnT family toxin [bacterium]|nr:BrnT family toxin [bacterium]
MLVIWDPRKAGLNQKKHGVSFEEAQSVLESDVQLVLEDKAHDEPRFVALGQSKKLNLLVVVYAYREADVIRIISARKATRKERENYEKRI